jgi:putative ATP-dependent endonuclease of OLD family
MYLKTLAVVNLRSCRLVKLDMERGEPNILIGLNDCGKSTILRAVTLLLDEKSAATFAFSRDSSQKSDTSNTGLNEADFSQFIRDHSLPPIDYSPKHTIILGNLVIEPGDFPTEGEIGELLQWAVASRPHDIWLCRSYNSNVNTSQLLILAPDEEPHRRLWEQPAKKLDGVIKELTIDSAKIRNENQAGPLKNIEKIKAIYARLTTKPAWHPYKPDKGIIVEARYFDWNFSFEQILTVATDALKKSQDSHLATARQAAATARQQAESDANTALDVFCSKTKKELPGITAIKARLFFEVTAKITDLFVVKDNADGEIHVESQGEGIKRLIWFALMRYSAFSNQADQTKNKRFIWCFDEPESHLYPKAQRDFFGALNDSAAGPAQILISTHSTVFIDKAKISSIRKASQDENGYTNISSCKNTEEILETLGVRNSDFLFFDRFFIVEGETEQELVPVFWRLVHNKSPRESNTQIVSLGGKDKRKVNLNLLRQMIADFRKEQNCIVYLFDGDAKFDAHLPNPANSFYVGNQDGEDAISTAVWMRALTKQIADAELEHPITVTHAEIDQLRDSISPVADVPKYEKVYPQLQKLIRGKIAAAYPNGEKFEILPSKGIALARMLSPHFLSKEDIPTTIVEAIAAAVAE